MFYKQEGSSASGIKVGPITFTAGQLFTSIISSLIVIPVNLIIVTLFRKAKIATPKIQPTKSSHVAKQHYWRQNIQSIELHDKDNVVYDNENQSDIHIKNKKSTL